MDHILKSWCLIFFFYVPPVFGKLLFWTLPSIVVSIPLRGICMLKPKTYSNRGERIQRKRLRSVLEVGLLAWEAKALKDRYFPTALTQQKYLFPTRHWILEQVGINCVVKVFCRYFWEKNIVQSLIFEWTIFLPKVIVIITCKLWMISPFCWWEFGKKLIIS